MKTLWRWLRQFWREDAINKIFVILVAQISAFIIFIAVGLFYAPGAGG